MRWLKTTTPNTSFHGSREMKWLRDTEHEGSHDRGFEPKSATAPSLSSLEVVPSLITEEEGRPRWAAHLANWIGNEQAGGLAKNKWGWNSGATDAFVFYSVRRTCGWKWALVTTKMPAWSILSLQP